MLLPDQVLPFLNHADEDVRRQAAKYLGELADAAPPQTADELWKAIDTFGSQPGMFGTPQSVFFLAALAKVPQNDASLERALEMLSQPRSDTNVTFQLFSYFEQMPIQSLAQHRDRILPTVNIATRSSLKHRLTLHEMPDEELWQGLLDLGIRSETVEDSSKVENAAAARIVDALCAHAQFAIPRAIELLNDSRDRYWLKTWCIDLLGRLRHNPAIDTVIDAMMQDDGDFLNQSAVIALARMDPEQVVPKLEAAYDPSDAENIYHRMRVPDSLGKMKHPLAEAALLRLLQRETNTEVIADISAALVDLCTTDGLEALRQIVIEERYDSAMTDVMEELVTLAKMTNFHPPELQQWKKDLNDPAKQREQHRHFLGKMGVTEEEADLMRAAFEGKSPAEIVNLLREPEPARIPETTQTFRRDSPKVGRNDPCPCGSGKKYKKCCGK